MALTVTTRASRPVAIEKEAVGFSVGAHQQRQEGRTWNQAGDDGSCFLVLIGRRERQYPVNGNKQSKDEST